MRFSNVFAGDNIGNKVGVFVLNFALGAVGREVIDHKASGDTPPTVQAKWAIQVRSATAKAMPRKVGKGGRIHVLRLDKFEA